MTVEKVIKNPANKIRLACLYQTNIILTNLVCSG